MSIAGKPQCAILSVVLSIALVASGAPIGVAYGDEPVAKDGPAVQGPSAQEAVDPQPSDPQPADPQPSVPVSIAGAAISGIEEAYGQTGKAIKPTPTVVLDGKTLKEGTDYRVAYKNNVKRGTATMTIEGIGDYTGKLTKKFKIQYRIKYVLKGGKNSKKNPSCYAGKAKNGVTAKLAKPKREGYKFLGWYTDKKCTEKVTAITGKGDKTYYAKWQKMSYSITYKDLGATGANHKGNPSTYTKASDTIKLKDPVRAGYYRFAGWYSDKAKKHRVKSIPKGSTGDITLYAKWQKSKTFTTGDKAVDREVKKLAKRYKSLKSAFNWVKNHRHKNFSKRVYPVGSTHWGIKEAKRFFFSDNRDCYGFAAAFYYLALYKGYDAKLVSGKVPRRSGGLASHGWVEIKMNGTTYVFDPDLQRQYPSHKFYKVTYANAPLRYHKK